MEPSILAKVSVLVIKQVQRKKTWDSVFKSSKSNEGIHGAQRPCHQASAMINRCGSVSLLPSKSDEGPNGAQSSCYQAIQMDGAQCH
jgi:hypothetical protein